MNSTRKSIALILLVLLAGIVIGGAATATYIRHNLDVLIQHGPHNARKDFALILQKRLQLTTEQQQAADALLADMYTEAHQLHLQTRKQLIDLFLTFSTNISQQLSTKQRDELKRIEEDIRRSTFIPPAPFAP